MSLPLFRYHPDPLASGSIVTTGAACECCGQARGYTYFSAPYCQDEIATLCPWCIADGSAARKFGCSFVDDYPLLRSGLDEAIVEEVSLRTPGYPTWQQEEWLTCCGDACEYHGTPTRESLLALDQEGLLTMAEDTKFPLAVLMDVIQNYTPGGSPAFYRFRCRHCGRLKHGADFD